MISVKDSCYHCSTLALSTVHPPSIHLGITEGIRISKCELAYCVEWCIYFFPTGANVPLVLSLAAVHLWVGDEDQPMTLDPALTHDPNHLSNELNHPNNHNLGNPEGLDGHAVNQD